MSGIPISALLTEVDALAASTAKLLFDMQRQPLAVSRKELRDVVTEADLAAERMVLERLRELTPEAGIVSEEAGTTVSTGKARWIVDPLDGTINYAAGLPWYSVTIAYQEDGRTRVGVLNAPAAAMICRYSDEGVATINGQPARVSTTSRLADSVVSIILTSHFNEAEVAETAKIVGRLGNVARGVRIIVSGGLEMSLVAGGQLDAYVSPKADIVSHAAAMALARAAGGRATDFAGQEATDDEPRRVVSNGLVHEELLDLLRDL